MANVRAEVLDWIETGRVAPDAVVPVLRQSGVLPGRAGWRAFILNLTLWLGAVACGAAVIFFFAYNWDDLGRVAKFGLAELAILAALAFYLFADRDGPQRFPEKWEPVFRKGSAPPLAAKAALVLATLTVGALLALVGQTYQTGADTWQLFAVWAVAVLPWVLIGRFGPLWLIWLALLHLGAFAYFAEDTDGEGLLWTLFALDSVALILWEGAARRGIAWLAERWSPRVVAVASGTMATALMLVALFDEGWDRGDFGMLAYVAWMAAAYVWYRYIKPDLFVLAGGALSLTVVVTAWLSYHLFDAMAAGGFLLIGMVIIGMSAGAAWWLRGLAREQGA